jgi:hypothetical protein
MRGLDGIESCEKILGTQSANSRSQLKAADNQNLDASGWNARNEGIHAPRTPLSRGPTDSTRFGAVRRADEIRVAGVDLSLPTADDVRQKLGNPIRNGKNFKPLIFGKLRPYPLEGHMYRGRRHDPEPSVRGFQPVSEKPDPLAAHGPEPLSGQLSAFLRAFFNNQQLCRSMTMLKDFRRLQSEPATTDNPI